MSDSDELDDEKESDGIVDKCDSKSVEKVIILSDVKDFFSTQCFHFK